MKLYLLIIKLLIYNYQFYLCYTIPLTLNELKHQRIIPVLHNLKPNVVQEYITSLPCTIFSVSLRHSTAMQAVETASTLDIINNKCLGSSTVSTHQQVKHHLLFLPIIITAHIVITEPSDNYIHYNNDNCTIERWKG
jgi:hypothetical protein